MHIVYMWIILSTSRKGPQDLRPPRRLSEGQGFFNGKKLGMENTTAPYLLIVKGTYIYLTRPVFRSN